jgi:hypothetical protein
MANDEHMSIQERRKYLRIMQHAYQTAKRSERGRLLDTMQTATGLNRKTLIRLMAGDLKRRTRQRERGRTYQRDLDQALRIIAESYDFICAERLTPNLLALAEQLAAHAELHLSEPLRQQLSTISIATVKRRLAQWQMRALALVTETEKDLWSPAGKKARDWLYKRGLKDKTLRWARIGFNTRSRTEPLDLWGLVPQADETTEHVYIPHGIVIPGLVRRLPWYLKVRQPHNDPKYLHVKGSKPAMYLLDTLAGKKTIALTEGEFDALLLWQEIEDQTQVGVATLGSTYNGLAVWSH